MSARLPKRPRLSAGTSYHDQVDVLDEYHAVHGREGHLRRVGNNFLMAPAAREVQLTSDSWDTASTWAPEDNPEYALDPDGDWYDEVIEGPIMRDDPPPSLVKKKKKKSHISVSQS